MSEQRKKVVLAYSGGLDTSVAIKWIPEKYHMDVITVTIDLGAVKDLDAIREKALKIGAKKAIVIDAKDTFVKYFIFPALQAGALYEGVYPLATALGRPLIAKLLADVALEENADAVAHGCTGKGKWKMTRDEEIRYAEEHNIPVEAKIKSPYSTDENLWGRSIECGVLEDPWVEPPEEVYKWTKNAKDTPDEPEYIEIEFARGIPIAINDEEMDGVTLINMLNAWGGKHGVGRIDHLENRLVGIKSREIYESPAAVILHTAHKALEGMIMTKDALRFKDIISAQYADLIYNGLWFSAFHQDLVAYVLSNQRLMNGTIRMRLSKGTCTVVGRKSPLSLYNEKLATYQKEDTFDHSASLGFIKIYGLPVKIQAQKQMDILAGREALHLDSIMPPKVKSIHKSGGE